MIERDECLATEPVGHVDEHWNDLVLVSIGGVHFALGQVNLLIPLHRTF